MNLIDVDYGEEFRNFLIHFLVHLLMHSRLWVVSHVNRDSCESCDILTPVFWYILPKNTSSHTLPHTIFHITVQTKNILLLLAPHWCSELGNLNISFISEKEMVFVIIFWFFFVLLCKRCVQNKILPHIWRCLENIY